MGSLRQRRNRGANAPGWGKRPRTGFMVLVQSRRKSSPIELAQIFLEVRERCGAAIVAST